MNRAEMIERLEAGPVYLTHKEAYDLAIWWRSDVALGMASLIRKAFVGGSLDAALALAERVLGKGFFGVRLDIDEHGGSRCVLEYDHTSIVGNAITPALALCAAILRASPDNGGER